MTNLQVILETLNDFPTLPTIYTALIDVIADHNASASDVAKIISRDQASSIKLLKSVNTAAYGLSRRIDTVTEAISYLGFNEVKNIILSISMIKLFSQKDSVMKFNVVDFWKHSIAVGVISRKLAMLRGVREIENYFIAGIIHDIGKLFFLRYFNNAYANVIKHVQEQDVPIIQAEKKILGVTHTVVGDLIAQKWKLPPSIRNTILNHQTGMVEGKANPLTATVHLANIIARMMELGDPGDNLVPRPNDKIWETLNVTPSTFVNLYDEVKMEYDNSISILLVN